MTFGCTYRKGPLAAGKASLVGLVSLRVEDSPKETGGKEPGAPPISHQVDLLLVTAVRVAFDSFLDLHVDFFEVGWGMNCWQGLKVLSFMSRIWVFQDGGRILSSAPLSLPFPSHPSWTA